MKMLDKFFEKNKDWADEIKVTDPLFFERLADEQHPECLWIGCSDSRVPVNEVVGALPGEIFVHRNIANLVLHTDINCLSVIQYAVEALKVKHIIICGHYGCGGVNAALDDNEHGLLDNWLRNIKDVYLSHKDEVDSLPSERDRQDLMCELNAIEQVKSVCNTTTVKNAWKSGQELAVHSWIYSIKDGTIKDLEMSVTNLNEFSELFPES